MYIPVDNFDQFIDLLNFDRNKVTEQLIEAVKDFQEERNLEPLLLDILSDPNRTPHGPSEIVDILTMQLSYKGNSGVAGFILKGSSFKRISPEDLSHQVFRLRKLADLKYAILGHIGNLLDYARDEFIQTTIDLNVDYTIIDAVDFARMAVVFGILCPKDGSSLEKGHCACGYRANGDALNIMQKYALEQLSEIHNLKKKSGIIIMPTGSGKTRISSIDSERFNAHRILYIAHSHEILDGAEKEFSNIYGTENIYRKWRYNDKTPIPSVHLSTIQSISRELNEISANSFDYLIIDEFHHAAAKSYLKLLEKTKPAFLLGLTATPFRGDQKDVIELCNGEIVVNFELRSGIDNGILVPYNYYGCFDDIDYSQLKIFQNGYTIKDLNKALIVPERDESIINKWRSQANGLATLAFCCSHKHANRMAHSFNEIGIPAREYLGNTPIKDRLKLVESLQYGDLKVLCVVDVLNEGVDIPFVECLLFLRPTESKRIFFQQLGRGLRKSPGKDRVLVFDFIGNFHNAYRVVEYLGLSPEETIGTYDTRKTYSYKQIINLPIGCEVNFDNRVIDIFAQQILDPRRATRHNISQILIYLYRRTSNRLGHLATQKEIDRNQILDSSFYQNLFGSWDRFIDIMRNEFENTNK